MTRRVERVAARGVARAKVRLAERLGAVRGVRVEETADGIAVEGRRLRARWLLDPALRWIGGWW